MKLSLLILLFFSFTTTFAQKNLAKGDKLYDRNLFTEAIPYYLEEMKSGDSKSKDLAMEKVANCYRITGEFEKAEEMYKKIVKKNKKNPEHFLNYAMSLKASAKYDEAEKQFREYKKLNPSDKMADIYIKSCQLAQKWLDEGIGSDVKNVEAINTKETEFGAVIYNNGVVYASSMKGGKRDIISFNGGNDVQRLDLYYLDMSKPVDNNNKPVPMEGLNSSSHDASPTFSADGKTVYFTRTVDGKRNKNKNTLVKTLQVVVSRKDETGKWSKPKSAFSFNSTEYSVGQPSLSPAGNRIYFMSDMPGGFGGTDIYFSDLQSNGEWGTPVNVGEPVNTFGHEMFPFIRNDNELYFSSDTHPGLGKLDIFSATLRDGEWKSVRNLKTPINSIGDDFAIFYDKKYNRGFLSSNRFNGKGSDDIYSFIELLPIEVTMNGNNFSVPDNTLFDGIKYKLINDETKEETILEPRNGIYSFQIPENKSYTLSARKEGFAYNKINMKLIARNSDKRHLELDLKPSLKPIKINGTLLDKDSLKPAPLAGIELLLKDSISQIEKKVTEEDGLFAFGNSLLPNVRYKIIAYKGSAPKNEKTGVTCTGIIKSNGQPVKNAIVKVLNDLVMEDQVRTDEEGRYTLTLKPDQDEYMVIASMEGYKDNFYETVTYGKKQGESITKDIEIQKIEPLTLSGVVKAAQSGIEGTQVLLMYNKQVVDRIKTNEDGTFNLQVIPDRTYTVTATKQGYFQKELEVSTYGKNSKDIMKVEIKLDTIQVNKTIEIKNIYYDYGKADLRYESGVELDKLIQFLNLNPGVTIELRSHTDSRGADDFNLKLSQERAETVQQYLMQRDISKTRIIAKGYGETLPIVPNAQTEDDHQKNRRTEFKILKQ